MNQRGLAPIFLIIGITLVLVIIGGAYYLGVYRNNTNQVKLLNQQSIPVPSNIPSVWKNFTDTQGLKLTLWYPPDFQVEQNTFQDNNLNIIYPALIIHNGRSKNQLPPSYIEITNSKISQILSDDLMTKIKAVKVGQNYNYSKNPQDIMTRLADLDINGNNMLVFEDKNSPGKFVKIFFLQKENVWYRFIVTYGDPTLPDYQKNTEILDKIISTIQF